MTSLPCSVLPRTLRFVLLALAWASLPLWPVTVAGAWLFDIRGVVITTAALTLCTLALFAAFFAGRVDTAIVKPAQEHAEREQMLVIALDRLSSTVTQPQPALRAVQ